MALIVRATPILKLFEAVSKFITSYQKIMKTAAVQILLQVCLIECTLYALTVRVCRF